MKSIVSVTTAAASYDLTTMAKVLSELKITDTATTADKTLLETQIADASSGIATYCDRVFPEETVSEVFWPDQNALNHRGGGSWGGQFWPGLGVGAQAEKLLLAGGGSKARFPVTSIISVTLDDELLDASGYRVDPDDGFLFRLDDNGYPWTWYVQKSVVVAYVGGFAEIPSDVDHAARLWVADSWYAAAQDPRLTSRNVYGVVSKTWAAGRGASGTYGLPPGVEARLSSYRRQPVA